MIVFVHPVYPNSPLSKLRQPLWTLLLVPLPAHDWSAVDRILYS